VAIEAFEDGLLLVLLDGRQETELDAQVLMLARDRDIRDPTILEQLRN
jgi:hypothetical protein